MALTRGIVAPGGAATGGGSDPRVYAEVPAGTIPGTGSFSTSVPFIAGSEAVYLNGVRQTEGVTCDYVRSESGGVGSGYDTIAFQFPLHVSDTLIVDFTPS